MTAATTDLIAVFERIFGPMPTTTRRPTSAAEQAAQDYAESIAEARADERLLGELDDRWMQERVDNHTEREWVG